MLPGSFVQFDIIIGCNGNEDGNGIIALQYSEDFGRTWKKLIPACHLGKDRSQDGSLNRNQSILHHHKAASVKTDSGSRSNLRLPPATLGC